MRWQLKRFFARTPKRSSLRIYKQVADPLLHSGARCVWSGRPWTQCPSQNWMTTRRVIVMEIAFGPTRMLNDVFLAWRRKNASSRTQRTRCMQSWARPPGDCSSCGDSDSDVDWNSGGDWKSKEGGRWRMGLYSNSSDMVKNRATGQKSKIKI